ncbi:MAG: hypothetical protein ACD_76C00141G0001 [uncultured bacterium]|nr:MAG: hypothetical protein ACD_76C00141G0001 [uncultured bacterium]HBD04952.1 hypothetical protein [Candidatus Uhrbacteria bacterium]
MSHENPTYGPALLPLATIDEAVVKIVKERWQELGYGGAKPLTPIAYGFPGHKVFTEMSHSPWYDTADDFKRKLQRSRRNKIVEAITIQVRPGKGETEIRNIYEIYKVYHMLCSASHSCELGIPNDETDAAYLVERFLKRHGLICKLQPD